MKNEPLSNTCKQMITIIHYNMYELSSMTFGQTSNTSVTNFTANIVARYSHLKSIGHVAEFSKIPKECLRERRRKEQTALRAASRCSKASESVEGRGSFWCKRGNLLTVVVW